MYLKYWLIYASSPEKLTVGTDSKAGFSVHGLLWLSLSPVSNEGNNSSRQDREDSFYDIVIKESSVDNSHRIVMNLVSVDVNRKYSTKGKVSSRKRTQCETGPESGRTPYVDFRIHTSFVMEEWRLVLRKEFPALSVSNV